MAQSSPNLLPLLIAAFWLSEALIAGLIANNKGRTFWGYFLGTLLLFGPLGFLMALLVARKPPQTPEVEKRAMTPQRLQGRLEPEAEAEVAEAEALAAEARARAIRLRHEAQAKKAQPASSPNRPKMPEAQQNPKPSTP